MLRFQHYYDNPCSVMQQEKDSNQLQRNVKIAVDETLGLLLQGFDYEKISLPLIRNTFTLWRNLAYARINTLPLYSQQKMQADTYFYLFVECCYRQQFIQKVEAAEEGYREVARRMESATPTNSQTQLELMTEYSRILWRHTLYCELFEDLVTLPYLISLFPTNKKYRLAPRFSELSPLRTSQQQGEMMEKVSQSVLKKGFGQLAEKVFTRTFLLRASSIAIRLNPVAIAATFAFSSLVDCYRRDKREEELQCKLREMIGKCKQNVQVLEWSYAECMGLVGAAVRGEQAAQLQLLERIQQVMEVDWLQVTHYKDNDGWEVVVLEGEPEEEK